MTVADLDPRDVMVRLLEQPLGRLRQLVEGGARLLFAYRVRVIDLDFADRFKSPARGRVKQRQRLTQWPGQAGGQASGHRVAEADGECIAGLDELLVNVGADERPGTSRTPVDHVRGDLGLRRARHPIGQVVRLVHHEQTMRRHDMPAGEHVDREQAVVRHDDVGLAGAGARRLGEALRSVRAPGRTDTLARERRHLAPRGVVDAGIEFVPVARLGLALPSRAGVASACRGGRPRRAIPSSAARRNRCRTGRRPAPPRSSSPTSRGTGNDGGP